MEQIFPKNKLVGNRWQIDFISMGRGWCFPLFLFFWASEWVTGSEIDLGSVMWLPNPQPYPGAKYACLWSLSLCPLVYPTLWWSPLLILSFFFWCLKFWFISWMRLCCCPPIFRPCLVFTPSGQQQLTGQQASNRQRQIRYTSPRRRWRILLARIVATCPGHCSTAKCNNCSCTQPRHSGKSY